MRRRNPSVAASLGLALAIALASGGVLVTAPVTAFAWEVVNLYDAFGKDTPGAAKSFGFSALVRHRGKTILFDAGTSADVLERNARALGVDLAEVDFAVASHAHADHVGGFDLLVRRNPKAKIYFPDDFFGAGGPLDFDVAGKEPGVVESLPKEQRYFDGESTTARLRSDGRYYKAVEYVKESRQLAPGVHLVATRSPFMGYFTRYPGIGLDGRPVTGAGAGAKELGLPELSLALDTDDGVVLLVGCSHSTVEVIVRETLKVAGRPIHLVAGGYHLIPYDRKTIEGIAARLKDELGVRHVAPAHCSGHLAFAVLRERYGAGYRFFGLGSVLSGGRPTTAGTAAGVRQD